VLGELVAHQHPCGGAGTIPATAGGLLGQYQRAADDAEGTVKAGADQILLVVIVVVERALGHVQPRRNAIHRSTAIALLVDEVGGCAQKGVCRVVAAGVEHP